MMEEVRSMKVWKDWKRIVRYQLNTVHERTMHWAALGWSVGKSRAKYAVVLSHVIYFNRTWALTTLSRLLLLLSLFASFFSCHCQDVGLCWPATYQLRFCMRPCLSDCLCDRLLSFTLRSAAFGCLSRRCTDGNKRLLFGRLTSQKGWFHWDFAAVILTRICTVILLKNCVCCVVWMTFLLWKPSTYQSFDWTTVKGGTVEGWRWIETTDLGKFSRS
jgi:hypothetical protein